MSRFLIALAVMLVGLVASACSQAGGSGGQLAGVTWNVTTYAKNGTMTQPAANETIDAQFDAGTVAGLAACNSYTGSYTASGSSLKVGPLATTKKACEQPLMDSEAAYLATLQKAASYTATKDTLTIYDGGGAKIIEYKAAPAATLPGTSWNVTGINNGKGALTSTLADTKVTLVFGTDGKVTGNGGCNTYNGGYEVKGSTITFGEIASTMMACPDAIMTQESAYFAALKGSTTWSVNGDKLELRDAGGALQVSAVKG